MAKDTTILDRLKPFDLLNYKSNNGDMTLTAAIAKMQADNNLPFDCPKCLGPDNTPAGPIPIGVITVIPPADGIMFLCDLCDGMLRTSVEYQADPANPGKFILVAQ